MSALYDIHNTSKVLQVAVVTADLIGSSSHDSETREEVLGVIKSESKKLTDAVFELYRGDSFQGIIYDVPLALEKVLQIKTAVNRLRFDDRIKKAKPKKIRADFRVAIGIGEQSFRSDSVGESDGAAFQYSGRQLDTMKSKGRIITLTTKHQNINDEFNVSLQFLEELMEGWSIASAEVIYYLLQGYKEVAIAKELGISQAAVNFRKKAAGWDLIVLLLDRYKQVIQKSL